MNMNYINIVKELQPFLILFMAIITFFYTTRNIYLVWGDKVYTSIEITSVINSATYISSIIVENLKNKPIIIKGVYLKIANQYDLEIVEYYDNPLILKPLEAIQINQKDVSFYSMGMKIVNIENLLLNPKVSKKVALLTTQGLIEEKGKIIIKNHPMLQMLKGKAGVITPREAGENKEVYEGIVDNLPVYSYFRITILRFASYLYKKYR